MTTPHDDLFHFAFRHVRHARSWIRSLLDADLAAAIDWDTMAPAPERVQGRSLRSCITDLMFEVALATNGARLFVVPVAGVRRRFWRRSFAGAASCERSITTTWTPRVAMQSRR